MPTWHGLQRTSRTQSDFSKEFPIRGVSPDMAGPFIRDNEIAV